MISLLLSMAFATTVYAPMTNRLETTVAHYFIDKDFHARKKDMLVINWADCQETPARECAMIKGYSPPVVTLRSPIKLQSSGQLYPTGVFAAAVIL